MIRALAIVLLFASAASAQVADGFVSQHVASYGADGRPLVYVSYDTQVSSGCWWCPQCQKWHCGPRPGGGGGGGLQPPINPGQPPQFKPRPPQNPTPPPTPPPDNPPPQQPDLPEPTPTIDQETVDRITADAKAEAIAAAKAEVSILVKNEIAANGCGCAEKWAEWNEWRATIEQRLLEAENNNLEINYTELAQNLPPISVYTKPNSDPIVVHLGENLHLPPFQIRLEDPRGLYSTPYAEVYLGQKVDLSLQPLTNPVQ